MSHESSRRVRRVETNSWAVSYIDLLSLLLCFFVIYYNSDEDMGGLREKNVDLLAKVDSNLPGSGVGSGGTGSVRAPASASYLSGVEADLHGLPVEITKERKGLYLAFKNVSFFDSGSAKLTAEARPVVEDIIARLAPFKDNLKITVQGHTDSRRVTLSAQKHSDNWELSALRATSVLKRFVQSGFPQEALSAEGFADTRVANQIEDLSYQRRITLIIEPREGP